MTYRYFVCLYCWTERDTTFHDLKEIGGIKTRKGPVDVLCAFTATTLHDLKAIGGDILARK